MRVSRLTEANGTKRLLVLLLAGFQGEIAEIHLAYVS